jgi:two-component system sensor histidine kinase KdpD
MQRTLSTVKSLLKHLLAILTIALTTGMLYVLRNVLDTPLVALLFLLPVGLCTALWGLGPGILAGLSAFLAFNYFFIQPYYTFGVHQTGDLIVLMVFLIVAGVISQLVGQAQAGLAAATAREREATKLYELSTALAGLQDDQAIAQTIASQALQTFRAERIELHVTGQDHRPQLELCLPVDTQPPSRQTESTIPLQTARGQLGEIRLWRSKPPFQPSEVRLLKTFASQGAIALERAWLTQAETHSKLLEESDRLKSVLLSSVSHELRTPLATIKAAITSLRSGEVSWKSSAREDLLAAVDDEADHLNHLVGNLLDMSRIESGALNPKREWNLISEIVGSVISRMRRLLDGRQLEIDIPDTLPLVPVDYVQMEQVFTNLISNSLKYAPAKSTIQIRAALEKDAAIRVQVKNQGPPVPEEHLERIFDKFYRVTSADRVTGTGLGLSICKGIIEAHDGRIWAENDSDGFAFNFTIPLRWDGAPPPRPPKESDTA